MRLLILVLLACTLALAQAPPAADIMILTDGETLVGRFLRSTGGSVRFKSDLVGEVTVKWEKVKEIRSSRQFAVVTKQGSRIAAGPVEIADQKIQAGQSAPVPVSEVAHVIEESLYEKAFVRHPSLLKGWRGTLTVGASLVDATQKSRTFTNAVSFTRAVPGEDWLPARDRTTVDFSSSYGVLTQPPSERIKTSIFHAGADRDEYLSASAFGFGQAQFDHNFSQGLDLQQTYSGGVGWSVIKRANEMFDLKAGLSFIRQQFTSSTGPQNLVSGFFEQKFVRHFGKAAVFTEQISVSPSWNNANALSALGNASLAMPVYRNLTFTLSAIENFLNDPPPDFRKNSVQLTTGLTYVLH